jgi:hypothetical protein
MDVFEEAVMQYLTHEGDVFLCAQYPIGKKKPDFVALNFAKPKHRVEVVEVSSAIDLSRLATKLNNRDWFKKLIQQLREKRVIDGDWEVILRVFVIKAHKDNLCKKIGSPPDVIVETIDDVFACLLDWRKRQDPRACHGEG